MEYKIIRCGLPGYQVMLYINGWMGWSILKSHGKPITLGFVLSPQIYFGEIFGNGLNKGKGYILFPLIRSILLWALLWYGGVKRKKSVWSTVKKTAKLFNNFISYRWSFVIYHFVKVLITHTKSFIKPVFCFSVLLKQFKHIKFKHSNHSFKNP